VTSVSSPDEETIERLLHNVAQPRSARFAPTSPDSSFAHTDTKYPDYRGKGRAWWTSVNRRQLPIEWKTVPCPEKRDTVFVFTASMGDDPGRARLIVNGKASVDFETDGSRGVRLWKDGPYRLAFISMGSAAGNTGIAMIGVPESAVVAGAPVTFRVEMLDGDPNAWFMVKDYHDTIVHEKVTAAPGPRDALRPVGGCRPWRRRRVGEGRE